MPQRFLRPGIRTSPRWNSVSHEAQMLYIAILTLVDDYGRYDGRPSVLWAEAFAVWNDQNPLKVVSPQETVVFCQALADSRLIQFYEVDGRKYLQVTQWQERARYKSHWPDPPKLGSCLNPAESCLNPASLVPRPSPSPSPSEPTTFGVVGMKGERKVPVGNGHPVKAFIAAWCDAYLQTTGRKYIVTGKDAGQAKLLIQDSVDPAELLSIARRAWGTDGFYCKLSHQLSSFANQIGSIRNELDKPKPSGWKNPMA